MSSVLRQIGFFVLFFGFASVANASYFRADLPSPNANPKAGTHVILTGNGMEVGDQWLKAGYTQALLFRDRPGTGPIRIIGAIQDKNTLPLLKAWGYTNIQVYEKTFTADSVLAQLNALSKIASIDFIGHNGALYGLALEDYDNRFFVPEARQLASLKSRMSKDAVVRLLGCNTGWNLAPVVAKALQVPVSGTFTFADIEAIFSTNQWFYDDSGRFPEGLLHAKTNSVSFATPVNCVAQGGCLRLKTVEIQYQGKHGNYGGTLPFAKYFCADLDLDECARRMAKSTYTFVGVEALQSRPTLQQFSRMIADQFCPSHKDDTAPAACRAKIAQYMRGEIALPRTFTTADGASMTCDARSCQFQKVCGDGECVMESTGGAHPTTYMDELDMYKRGFELWSRE